MPTQPLTSSFFWRDGAPLALASKSAGRRLVLEQTGIPFTLHPADVDERRIEAGILADGGGPDAVVAALAAEKARVVSHVLPGRFVLGADQAASCAGRIFGKPDSREKAAAQLRLLSGRMHRLHSAVALARDGEILFETVRHADIALRALSDAFIDSYLDAMGDAVLTTAGAYQVEGLGAHLFASVQGDHWTIIGLPLLPVLEALRQAGALRG